MAIQTLYVYGPDGTLLIHGERRMDKTTLIAVSSSVAYSVERWNKYGLDEWLGYDHGQENRHTHTDHEDFLPRLKNYLEQQFKFKTNFIES